MECLGLYNTPTAVVHLEHKLTGPKKKEEEEKEEKKCTKVRIQRTKGRLKFIMHESMGCTKVKDCLYVAN